MYNSVLVSLFAKLLDFISTGYETSFLKRIVDFIKNIFKSLGKNSIFLNIVARKKYLEDTCFYRIYVNIINFVNRLFKGLNDYFRKIGSNSLFYNISVDMFGSHVEALRTGFVFTSFFGFGLIAKNIVQGYTSGRSYIIGLALIIISLVGLGIREDYKSSLESSFVYKLIYELFTVDEGGDQWW